MELKKIFDVEKFKPFIKIMKNHRKNKKAFSETRYAVSKFVEETLPNLNKSKLKKVDLKGHRLEFFDIYNKFVENKKITEVEYQDLIDGFSYMINDSLIIISHLLKTNIEKEEIIFKLDFKLIHSNCEITGEHIIIMLDKNFNFDFKKYRIEYFEVDGQKHPKAIEDDLTEIKCKNKIYEKIIEFKTGKLLINDWFRDKNNLFNQHFKDKNGESLNYLKGRIGAMNHFADLNLVSIMVGNSCPSVFLIDDNIVVGEGDEYDDEDSRYKGMVCTDLWNATIIDEEHLKEVYLQQGLSKSSANKEIKRFKKDCISLKVKPGKYKLKFCGDFEDFVDFYGGDISGKTPYFVLEYMGKGV